MRSSETVSVVIPYRDQAAFLAEAVASAGAQDGVRVQMVIVDDGSTAPAADVLARVGPEVGILRRLPGGVSAARNAGLAATNGEFVVFLDADDRLLPGALQLGREVLIARPECAWVAGRHRRIDVHGMRLPDDEARDADGDECADATSMYRRLLRGNFVHTAAVMYRREPLEHSGGFDPRLEVCEDWQLYLRLCRSQPAAMHAAEVSEYRAHSDQTTARRVEDLLRTGLAVLADQRPLLRDADERAAWCAGRRFWRQFYGHQLLERMRDDLRARRFAAALWRAAVVARHAPGYTAGAAWRTLLRAVRRR